MLGLFHSVRFSITQHPTEQVPQYLLALLQQPCGTGRESAYIWPALDAFAGNRWHSLPAERVESSQADDTPARRPPNLLERFFLAVTAAAGKALSVFTQFLPQQLRLNKVRTPAYCTRQYDGFCCMPDFLSGSDSAFIAGGCCRTDGTRSS